MRARLLGILLAALPGLSSAAQFSVVQIQRLDQDMYKDTSTGIIIKTQFCFSFHMGEAVLKIEGPAGPSMGWLWFGDHDVCQVIALYK
jgi:hypothetical protein